MPPLSSLLAFAAVSFALIIVPGPSVLFVISRAVALGRRAALLTVLGNAGGIYVQVVLVALGLGVLVERSIVVFTALKLAGAGYLVWLGVMAVLHRRTSDADPTQAIVQPARRSVVVDGFVVGVANPKSIVFFAAILPQFVDRGGAAAGTQMAVLGVVFVVVALICDSAWGLLAGTARDWFASSPLRLNRLSAAGGAVMIALGLRLAFTGRSA